MFYDFVLGFKKVSKLAINLRMSLKSRFVSVKREDPAYISFFPCRLCVYDFDLCLSCGTFC